MLENPMVTAHEKALRKDEKADRARERCFEMHLAEFLEALRGPAHGLVSAEGGQRTVWAYVADLMVEDANVLAFLRCVREHRSVPMFLAELYADQQTEYHAESGGLDV